MSDKVHELMSQLIEHLDPGAMMTKFVVIVEGLDSNGERAVYSETHEDAMTWDIMGLLKWGLVKESAGVIADHRDED